MVKFLFGLFVISRIIKMFKLLRGKDISNVDEIIEKVEHMYKFSDIDTSINYDTFIKNFVLIVELIVTAIILATISLFFFYY